MVEVRLGLFKKDSDFGLDLGGGGEGALEGDGLKGEAAGTTQAAVWLVVIVEVVGRRKEGARM